MRHRAVFPTINNNSSGTNQNGTSRNGINRNGASNGTGSNGIASNGTNDNVVPQNGMGAFMNLFMMGGPSINDRPKAMVPASDSANESRGPSTSSPWHDSPWSSTRVGTRESSRTRGEIPRFGLEPFANMCRNTVLKQQNQHRVQDRIKGSPPRRRPMERSVNKLATSYEQPETLARPPGQQF